MIAQSAPDPAADDSNPEHYVLLKRTGTAFLGWIPGAVAGGFLGYAVPHGSCNCDDPGLKEFAIGAAVGGVFGSAIGAAFPKLNSSCSFARRFGLGLLGAAVGTGVGLIPITEGAQPITVAVFSSIGAGIADWPC